ncbi:MAG: hypothetical protein A2044_08615 [Candidatus Firestonebacteria bacterium GWA2_43_8]|nr:MAG: hypothetical protein A2044_08615 [Candidatus Firestonebacteria bacterium GWA2_43_8]
MLRETWQTLKTLLVVTFIRISKKGSVQGAFQISKIKNIIIVRLDKVGDLILSTPVFENIKKTIPEAKITVLVRSYNAGVLKNNPFVDEVLLYDNKKDRKKYENGGYDLALSLIYDFNLTSAYACYKSGAAWRAGYKDKYSKQFFNLEAEKDASPKYELLRNLDLIKLLGFKTDSQKSRLYPGMPEETKIDSFIKGSDILKDDLVIGFNPGTGRKRREWSLEKYIELGKSLVSKHNAKIVVLWGKADKIKAESIVKSIGKNSFMACETNIIELASLMKRFKLLVCGNTGPAHVAMAMEVPLVGLYGERDDLNWTPAFRDKSKLQVLTSGRCSNIPVAEVLNGVEKFL